MRKLFALLLCFVILIGLTGCGAEEVPPTTAPEKPYAMYAGLVADTRTWYDELMALPIANDAMTEEELRRLCVETMRINLTFPWTPNADIEYGFYDRYTGDGTPVSLRTGIAYSGMFYCNNNARGNVWKALEYYDLETGVVDIEAMDGKFLSVMSSACARSCEWGWSRVSNSHDLGTMEAYDYHNSGILTVGPYTYSAGKYSFVDRTGGTIDIIRDNGERTMFASYALLKPADGIYSSKEYHVEMVTMAPVVVYDESGNIDPDQSYLLTQGQGAVGSTGDSLNYLQENGVILRPLGTVDKRYTFRSLLERGYIPFTMPEFTGADPVEPGDAWLGTLTERLENGTPMSLNQVMFQSVHTNYAICVVELQIQDPQGNVLLSKSNHHDTTPHTYSQMIGDLDFRDGATPLCDGSNTLHVYVRMANGQRLEAFRTVLEVS